MLGQTRERSVGDRRVFKGQVLYGRILTQLEYGVIAGGRLIESDPGQTFQRDKMSNAGIRDLRPGQVEDMELLQARQVCQSRVADVGGCKGQCFEVLQTSHRS